MPTYEYKCEKCGHRFEKMQSMSAGSLRKCPKCGKQSLKRLIGTGAGVIFKGSGFYATDYRSESYKQGAKSETTSPKTETAKTSEKKEAAPSKTETPKAEAPKEKGKSKK